MSGIHVGVTIAPELQQLLRWLMEKVPTEVGINLLPPSAWIAESTWPLPQHFTAEAIEITQGTPYNSTIVGTWLVDMHIHPLRMQTKRKSLFNPPSVQDYQHIIGKAKTLYVVTPEGLWSIRATDALRFYAQTSFPHIAAAGGWTDDGAAGTKIKFPADMKDEEVVKEWLAYNTLMNGSEGVSTCGVWECLVLRINDLNAALARGTNEDGASVDDVWTRGDNEHLKPIDVPQYIEDMKYVMGGQRGSRKGVSCHTDSLGETVGVQGALLFAPDRGYLEDCQITVPGDRRGPRASPLDDDRQHYRVYESAISADRS